MTSSPWGYLAVFLAAAVLSLGLTPAAMRVAARHSILDWPTAGKAHADPTPYLGGVAIALAFLLAVGGATAIDPPGPRTGEVVVVLVVALAVTVLGLLDDTRGLGVGKRLGVETFGALAIWQWGEGVALFGQPVLDASLTVVWIVGVTNAFNLLDHSDGLAAGVATIAAGWFFVIAALNGQELVAGLAIGLAGCGLAFLPTNLPPARIFMGDAGSLFIGFLLAVLGVKLTFEGDPRSVTFLVPILVLGIPLFDTALVVVSRLSNGRSPLRGGLDHTAHRLRTLGVSNRGTVALVYAAGVSCGWLALAVANSDRLVAYLIAGLVVFVATVAGMGLLSIRTRDAAPPTWLPKRLMPEP